MLYQVTFPRIFESAEKLKNALGDIDMYDKVKDGLARTEALAREGQYEEAQDCVLALNRELMEASGTAEALRKRFPSKN